MNKFVIVVLFLAVFAGVAFSASKQRSSTDKFAIGYSQTTLDFNLNNVGVGATNLSKVAGRYWFNNIIGIDASLGFTGGDAQTAFLIGAKILGKVISVKQLDVYWLAGIDFGSYDPKINGINSITIFMLRGGFGAEYYILPCLSVLTELGIEFMSGSGSGESSSSFGLFADWLPQAGIRFYF